MLRKDGSAAAILATPIIHSISVAECGIGIRCVCARRTVERVPELPEVETIANGVNARVRGRRIAQVWTSGKPQTFKSPETEIVAALTGAKIESVRRVGKTIVMTVTRDAERTEFLIHLGMTGRLLVSTPEMPAAPHTHAVLTLDDGR